MFAFALLCMAIQQVFGTSVEDAILAMAAPAVTAPYFDNYITTLDLQARKVLPELIRRYGNQGVDFFNTIRALGYERVDDVSKVEHYEEEWILNTFLVASQTAVGGGAYSAAAVCELRLTSDADNKVYPQLNQVILFTNDIIGIITAVTPGSGGASTWVFTVRSARTGINLPAVANGTELAIVSNAFPEGSGQPDSVISGVYKWENVSQIIKASRTASGTELVTKSWIDSIQGESVKVGSWFYKGLFDLQYEMMARIQGAWLSGENITNTAAVVGTQSLVGKGTRGLIPEMNAVSEQYPYTPGTWELQNFYDVSKLRKKTYASRFAAFFMGIDLSQEVDMMLFEANKDTAVQFAAMIGGGKAEEGRDMEMTLGFKYVTIDGTVFCLKTIDAFYHPKLYGLPTYDYNQRGFIIPLNKFKDPKTKNDIPSIGIVYKGMGANNRKMKVWETGANAAIPNSTIDVKEVHHLTEFTAEFFAANQFIQIKPA